MTIVYGINIDLWKKWLANLCQWEGRNMENDKPYDPYAKDAQIKNDYLKENHVLKNERSMRGDSLDGSQGARLRMDVEAKVPFPKNYMIDESTASQSSGPLETLEQERNRLSRKLIQTLSENETRIRVLKDMLEGLNRWQKNGYYLRDSINNSSQIQMDQIHQMREYLK
jgi:hypothetical protein